MNFQKELFPDDLEMSPVFVIDRFKAMLEKYGKTKVMSSAEFQKATEMYITAKFFALLSTITKRHYYIKPEYKEYTPDTYVFSYIDHPKNSNNQERETILIEVTEWEDHNDDLMDVIKKKINRVHLKTYVLLVHVKKSGQVINLEEIHQKLMKEKVNFAEVWLISPIKGPTVDYHGAVKFFPDRLSIQYSLYKAMSELNEQPEISISHRGVGKGVVGNGDNYLPLP